MDIEDRHCDYNTGHDLPSSPTPISPVSLSPESPLTLASPAQDTFSPTLTSSHIISDDVLSKPAPPSDKVPPNTLHAFFGIPHRSPSVTGPTSSIPKRKASSNEKAILPVSKKHKPLGTSKSAQYEAQARAAVDNGAPVDSNKFSQFKSKILKLDPHAEFLIGGDVRMVRHSKCGGVKKQKSPYNTSYFVEHVEKCRGPSKKNAHVTNINRSVLTNFLQRQPSGTPTDPSTSSRPNSIMHPCCGLTPEQNSQISVYLMRSQAIGGGARPRRDIVRQLFGEEMKWGDLNKHQQLRVERIEATEFRWLNFREQGFILSATCLKTLSSEDPQQPCSECSDLTRNKVFKNALRRKLPKEENLRYTPSAYRAKMTGEQYAKMVGVYEIVQKATTVR